MLWKSSQLRGEKSENVNEWKMYQTWMKLEEAIRETWVVAGRTIQSFAKVRNLCLFDLFGDEIKFVFMCVTDGARELAGNAG